MSINIMDPQKLRNYYNVSDAKGSKYSTQAIYAVNQYFSPDDLSVFQLRWGLPLQAMANFVGGHVSDDMCRYDYHSCAEANLDAQFIIASSPSSPTTFWDLDQTNSWLNWLLSVANTPNPPLVLSISYVSYESQVSTFEKNSFNTEAIKLSARGVTLVAASGDDGAIDRYGICRYLALFPASNPYVTAVGATSVSQFSTMQYDEFSFF